MDRNPAERMVIRNRHGSSSAASMVSRQRKRRPFSVDELNTIFHSEQYRAYPEDAAMRWMPLVCLYQGFRMNEALQLEPTDTFYQDNIFCINITDEYSGDLKEIEKEFFEKRLKTPGAKRLVPMHPELIRLGFLDLCRLRLKQRSVRIFKDIKPAATGYFSDILSPRFRTLRKRVGLDGRGVTFHSLRHNFADVAKNANVPREIRFALGGWKTAQAVGDEYGEGYSIQNLLAHLRKVQFIGLDVPEIKFEY